MIADSGSPREARIVHHRADELLIFHVSIPEITLLIQEGTQHAHQFSSPLPDLIDVKRPGESCI